MGSKANNNLHILKGNSFKDEDQVKEYRYRWEENPQKHIVEKFPIHLDIESTSFCNLRCPFCASSTQKYEYGYLSFEHFKKIIDEGAQKGLCSIKLNFRGEPLLHPEITEFVAYAKAKGIIDVFFNTNATLLNANISKKLLEAGLDRLIVSFEGVTKKVYESNRVGADFDRTISNIRTFANLRNELGKKTKIRFQTVRITDDEEYTQKYQAFWSGVADEITCIDMREEGQIPSEHTSSLWECSYPWLRLCITWDGFILTCPFMNLSMDNYQWKGFGNIQDISIEDAWHSDRMTYIRKSHLEKKQETIDPCRLCSYRRSELFKEYSQ